MIDLLGWGFVEDFEFFFFFFWLRFLDLEFVGGSGDCGCCGGGCSGGCCCGGGCSSGCCVAVVVAVAVGPGGDWIVHLYFCCVLDKYIILMGRKYYFNV